MYASISPNLIKFIFTNNFIITNKDSDKKLPTLTKAQETKLKQLTLVTLASQNKV